MAKVSYKDSWEEIENQIKTHVLKTQFMVESAIKIKSVLESTKNTKRLIRATWTLAIFTTLLFLSTLLYAGIGYKAYESSQGQTEALKALTQAVIELPKKP